MSYPEIIPEFVLVVGDIWTLANDKWTTPYILERKTLAWDETFSECVGKIGTRKGWVVDVGAFIGDSTAWFLGHPILTFEPQRDAFVCLQHNIKNAFHLPFPAGTGELVTLQFGEGGNMGSRVVKTSGETVRSIKIDDLHMNEVAFIKIDVEGWEPKVLEGCTETIRRCRPFVRIEYNGDGLDRAGFTYSDIEKHFKGWNWIEVFRYGKNQWDVLYIP